MDLQRIYEVLVGRKVATGPHTWNVYDEAGVLIAEDIVLRANPGALFTFETAAATAARRPRRLLTPIQEARTLAIGGRVRTRTALVTGSQQHETTGAARVRAIGGVATCRASGVSVAAGVVHQVTGTRATTRAHVLSASAGSAVAAAPTHTCATRGYEAAVSGGTGVGTDTAQSVTFAGVVTARGVRRASTTALVVAATLTR